MSYGFRETGRFEIVGAVDLQKGKPGRGKSPGSSTDCNPTYERNIGVRPKNADLNLLDPGEYRLELGLERGELDVLISCAPCTGFSQKNARNHLEDDPRNQLVERSGAFVAEFLPEFFVLENVKELLRGSQRHHFDNLAGHLRKLGYDVWAGVQDLADHGLPQRRVRALVLAWRHGAIQPFPPGSERPKTVRETIGPLAPIAGGESDPHDPMHTAPANSERVLERLRAIPKDGGSWGDVMANPALSEDEKRRLLIPSMFRAKPGQFPDVYGRLAWDSPAVTITRECAHVGNGRYAHPEQDRLLSVREMALLQGFPASYHFEGPITSKYNQIGDAVPPMVARLVAEHVLRMKDSGRRSERESTEQWRSGLVAYPV